jgi:hypothetical protein
MAHNTRRKHLVLVVLKMHRQSVALAGSMPTVELCCRLKTSESISIAKAIIVGRSDIFLITSGSSFELLLLVVQALHVARTKQESDCVPLSCLTPQGSCSEASRRWSAQQQA